MKRVTYISRFSRHLTGEEIQKIAELSIRNNERDGLTGVLFTYKDVFYQIIEGPVEILDARLSKIFADDRHRDLFVLKVELNLETRAYSDWAMKTVILDDSQDFLMRPVSEMLGDGLMAVFNADETAASLEAVRQISAKLKSLRASRSANDPFSLLFAGFGISTGKVLEGNVGSVSRKDYTYLGDTVNTAARLQAVTRKVGRSVIFDESVLAAGNLSNVQPIGRYVPRGKDTELRLFSLTDLAVRLELPYDELKARIRDLAQ
ncbi:BLUF domain-containing protein [Leptonema illini]|uniref:BLUF domain protein n=1 Tax=Leptonema illini DSM 21528 TaxID=929563 RepID=H2CIX2_9LEPT|nr:BLUF domain-containing protein [Leptonema illini]EHQ08139.1 BLUF domain protein [Leptonema illini DSM 21528]